VILIICNLTPVPRADYQIGVPEAAFYREIFNSDSEWYGGSGSGNQGGMYSKPDPSHGFQNSIRVLAPPLGVCMFRMVTGPRSSDELPATGPKGITKK